MLVNIQLVELVDDVQEARVPRRQESRAVHAKPYLSNQKNKLNAQVVELVDTLS